MADDVKKDVKKGVKNPPCSPRSGAPLKPFNSVTAKAAQEASVRARNLRKAMRAQLLEAAVHDAKIGELFVQAYKKKDPDLMKLVETGMRLVGLDFASSEEAVTKLDVKSDNKVNTSGTLNITFTDAKTDA